MRRTAAYVFITDSDNNFYHFEQSMLPEELTLPLSLLR